MSAAEVLRRQRFMVAESPGLHEVEAPENNLETIERQKGESLSSLLTFVLLLLPGIVHCTQPRILIMFRVSASLLTTLRPTPLLGRIRSKQ
jgi:hypothetical protein